MTTDDRARVVALTEDEERDLRAAFDRDRWSGEWNSVPTAADRILAQRAAADPRIEAVRAVIAAETVTIKGEDFVYLPPLRAALGDQP